MRVVHGRKGDPREFRRRLERLERLPLRPTSPRFLLGETCDEIDDQCAAPIDSTRGRSVLDLDPGWVVHRASCPRSRDPLSLVAASSWWSVCSREVGDVLSHLWRHDIAVALASRRLARESGDPDPEAVARAGLLHGLGRWAVATIDPEWIARWFMISESFERRERERLELGIEMTALGERLAKRWGLEALVVDATWLHGDLDGGLEGLSKEPGRILLIQQAFRFADRTPWSLGGSQGRELGDHDPRVKLLTAEVQARCAGPMVESDATPREEKLTRSIASLRLKLADQEMVRTAQDRLISALATSDPTDDPEAWAEVAGLAFCGSPGVSTARVVWCDDETLSAHADRAQVKGPSEERPCSHRVPIEAANRRLATVELWVDADRPGDLDWLDAVLPAWRGWAAIVAERSSLDKRWNQLVGASRLKSETEESHLRKAKLDALAEFAAGAGHELNNPLAVIVGRAQLLLVAETDPKSVRSLRAILTQAQRAHRILRDLMYVARPPEPRPRFCNPDEIVRTSVRDFRSEAEDRDVRLSAEIQEPLLRVWTDPDALRHLADSLIRNALEATPPGGLVKFSAGNDGKTLKWSVQDSGRGITPVEGLHLFDPFFCGREAGRGLGMGLPRVARYVALAEGEMRWHSLPGKGATFLIRLPLAEPPKPPDLSGDGAKPSPNLGDSRPAVA